ncbi:hypothetical protein U3A58_18255 [Algoriphagus sp. C2-6-M1]|uniref:hypothetical protein n=1 Tax=Algoriphagus persicinus TaxID=3108754 RepID=UPI002B3FA4B9|nr:hypothetical protein [Algoriphagus sp. C2-6-M1]MEB2782339.1 hypothetical protein [Algoriphagus sp. C2-6-M1]
MKNSIVFNLIVLFVLLAVSSCSENTKNSFKDETPEQTMTQAEIENEAWHMEELYWEYVQNIDTVSYKTH